MHQGGLEGGAGRRGTLRQARGGTLGREIPRIGPRNRGASVAVRPPNVASLNWPYALGHQHLRHRAHVWSQPSPRWGVLAVPSPAALSAGPNFSRLFDKRPARSYNRKSVSFQIEGP